MFCPQVMSVLLFIEHAVEVSHGKASCRLPKTLYLRIGRAWLGQEAGSGPARWVAPLFSQGEVGAPLALWPP